MYRAILVPLDGSPAAEAAVPYALALRRLSGGSLMLARVVPSAVEPPALYSMTDPETWLLRRRQMQAEAEAYLAALAARPDVAASRPRYAVPAGDVGPAIVHLIEHEAIDVLVMTTRQRHKVARWVLGSTADYLVQHAPVPVLLVRQNDA